ncbi:MAG: hypothetical protein GXO91_03215 [FCB group bacterium]|nr:hypothetical protein [FCB group bacterium]
MHERRKHKRAVWIDRRSEPQTGENGTQDDLSKDLQERNRHLKYLMFWILVSLIMFLNMADYYLTYIGVNLGAKELNPIMDFLIGKGWEYVALFKLSIMIISLLALWRLYRYTIALWVASFITIFYTALLIYHYFNLGTTL